MIDKNHGLSNGSVYEREVPYTLCMNFVLLTMGSELIISKDSWLSTAELIKRQLCAKLISCLGYNKNWFLTDISAPCASFISVHHALGEMDHSDNQNMGLRTFPMVTKASATRLFLPPMVATIRSPSPQFSINVASSTSAKKV